jgi:hypothetical protein
VYCSERCKLRAKGRRRERRRYRPPAVSVLTQCDECGTWTLRRKFCSPVCKQRAKDQRKMARYRADPEFRRAVLDRQARKRHAAGVRARTSELRWCEVQGCQRIHYAKGRCRLHYSQGRAPLPRVTLWASVQGQPVPITCVLAAGLVAQCPRCGALTGAATLCVRICVPCNLRLVLNGEEVSWLNSIRPIKELPA